MIDPAILRTAPETLRESLTRRGSQVDVDELVELEASLRRTRQQAEEARAQQKESGKAIAQLQGEEKKQAIAAAGELAENYRLLEKAAEEIGANFDERWATIPNLVDPTAADGLTDVDNVELKRVGEPTAFDFEAADFAQLGERLDVIDMERGAKVSGSRFGFLKGQAVILEFALVRYAFDRLMAAGFTPMIPPVLVREQALYGTGFFPG